METHSTTLRQALDELQRRVAESPAIADHAAVLAEVLPVLAAADDSAKALELTAESARCRLLDRVPLLRDVRIQFDEKAFEERLRAVSASISRRTDSAAMSQMAGAMDRILANIRQCVEFVTAARGEDLVNQARQAGLDPSATLTVLRLALFPIFAHLNEVTSLWRKGLPWPNGFCPVCGSWPLLGEFRGLQQIRWLRCGLCTAEWEFPRLKCPFCGQKDHRQLGILGIDGQESRWRCATCDECHGYVKMLQTLERLSDLQLLVLDVATLPLDIAAIDRGYRRP